ncbi:ABC transporter permease [Dehalococcoidia bacterium]|nr:ABC transporter permease [Dehalococcoidia bacterium]
MKQLKHIWFIAMKDLKLFAADRMALSFAILYPFLFVVLFNFLLAGIGGEDERLELHLVTQEAEGGLSHQIIEALQTKDESQLKPGEPRIVWTKDYDEARQAVEDKELGGFLAFPADFTEGVLMGYGAQLEVIAHADAFNTRAALNGLARAIASRVGAQRVANHAIIGLLIEQGLIGQAIQQLFLGQEAIIAEEAFIGFEIEKVGKVEAENPANFVIPGYLVMFTFFTAGLSAVTIVRERQNHTLERLLAGSVRRESILGGIFTGTVAKGLIQIAIFWTAGILIFGIDLGLSPAAVIILSILMVLMSSAFGIMLATLVKTPRSASSIAVLASLVLAPLGGCWWPLFITPEWMQFIAKITPHGWANTGFNKLMVFGADFSAAVPEMLALVGFAVVFGLIAIWRFRTSAV